MPNVTFTVNGRRVPTGPVDKAVRDALEKELIEQTKQNVQARLRRIHCPEHHQSPRVTFSGTSQTTLRWSIVGCCDRLVTEARRVLQ